MSSYDPTLFVNQEQKIRGFQKLLQPTTPQAIMVIEAARDMGKTWLMSYLQDQCQQPDVATPATFVDFRHPREIHEIQDTLGLIRLLRNKLNQPTYFHELNHTINSFTSDKQEGMSGRVLLRGMMERYFDLDDLAGLAFDLHIDFDNRPGNMRGITKSGKIRALIAECEQQGRLAQLVELCGQQRPSVDWSPVLSTTSPTLPSGVAEVIEDQNGRLWADSDIERQRAERQINDAFFACLEELLVAKGRAVLLFDSVEEAPDVARQWLRQELLLRLRDGQIKDIVIIISGRKTPDLTDLGIRHLLVQTSLAPFMEDHVREYFEVRRKISGLDLHTIIRTSGGVPGALAMMADHARDSVQEDDDFFRE